MLFIVYKFLSYYYTRIRDHFMAKNKCFCFHGEVEQTLGKPSKKNKIKSVDFFLTRRVGVNHKSTPLKKCGFLGGGEGS